MIGIVLTYGGTFLALGIIALMCVRPKPDETIMARRARIRRARIAGRVKQRTHFDARIKRHRKDGGYHEIGGQYYVHD